MSASGAPEAAGGAPGPSAVGGDSTLDIDEDAALSHPLLLLAESDAGTLLEALLSSDDPRFANMRGLLQDDEGCSTVPGALKAMALGPSDHWGPAVAESRCSA